MLGVIESVHIIKRGVRIKRVEFRQNVRAFFPQGQTVRNNEVSVKRGFDSSLFL